MRTAPAVLLLAAAATGFADDDTRPRRLELHAGDVGRLALKNGPEFRVRTMDTAIARTRVDEALGAFDALFTSHAGFGGSRDAVFIGPTGVPVPGSSGLTASTSSVTAGAGVEKTEEWGGSWRMGYDAQSVDRRGAATFASVDPRFEGGLSGTYRQPLLRDAGRDVNLAGVHVAQKAASAQEMSLARDAELTVESAEAAYWDLVGAGADRDLKLKSLDVARELRAVVKARVDSGRGIPVDLTEADAGIARREVDVIAAENVVANAADRLRELVLPFTGPSPDLEITLVALDAPAASAPVPTPMPVAADIDAAEARRSDARAIALRLDAALAAETKADDEMRPSLDAVVSGGLVGRGSGFRQSWTRIGDRREYRWDAGLELTVPIGNLAATARATRARRERERVEREADALRNTIARELREAARNARSAADRIAAAVRATQASREQLDAERSRLDSGRATPFQVLEAEEKVTEAAAAEVTARVDYEKARIASLRAAGALLAARGLAAAAAGE